MKILYITLENLSLHKGSVVHVKEIVSGFRKLGHQVGLFGSSWDRFKKADHFYNLPHSILYFSRFSWFKKQFYLISSIFLLFYLFLILPRYDIIYARDYHTVIIALLPRLVFNKKLVFEINGLANEEQRLKGDSIFNRILSFFIQKAEMLATQCSDRIVSVTPQIATYLIRLYHCRPDKVRIVGNGVNTKKFYPIGDKILLSNLRERIGIAHDDIVIAFVGNLAPWQGVENLIKVAPTLLKEFNHLKFLIIGDGILKERFREEVNRLGVPDHFIFTGMVDYEQIPKYINIADICVLLKRRLRSGYSPIKLYEYMACGKPILSSRVEGLEFIETEGIGILTEPENLVSIEEAFSDLLREPGKRIDMGRRGLQLVHEKFDWESRAKKIEKILEELV